LTEADLRKLDLITEALGGSRSEELFFTERGKTGTPVGGMLSARTMRLLAAYLDQLGVTLTGEAYIFRNRSRAH